MTSTESGSTPLSSVGHLLHRRLHPRVVEWREARRVDAVAHVGRHALLDGLRLGNVRRAVGARAARPPWPRPPRAAAGACRAPTSPSCSTRPRPAPRCPSARAAACTAARRPSPCARSSGGVARRARCAPRACARAPPCRARSATAGSTFRCGPTAPRRCRPAKRSPRASTGYRRGARGNYSAPAARSTWAGGRRCCSTSSAAETTKVVRAVKACSSTPEERLFLRYSNFRTHTD